MVGENAKYQSRHTVIIPRQVDFFGSNRLTPAETSGCLPHVPTAPCTPLSYDTHHPAWWLFTRPSAAGLDIPGQPGGTVHPQGPTRGLALYSANVC